jgi:hypothetical protein
MGQYTTAESFTQTTIGRYNLPLGTESSGTWVSTDPLFVVGNGTGSGASRSNAMMILKNGNVGIGTTAPRGNLDVNGTIISAAASSNATATINFATGNLQYTANNCGAINLHNMKDGASYSFAVQGATAATCSFLAYTDAGVTGLTVHMPTDHGATTASKHTMYTFLVMGTHVYVAWVPGL